jgi:DNA-binding LacI/PurR family transcriptional regulator
LSIVGFDGIDLTALLGPPLTSVDIHPRQLGERLAQLLISVIQNETGRGLVTEWLDPNIIERASVRQI